MVVEIDTNIIIESHVWLSTDTAILPPQYDATKYKYIEHIGDNTPFIRGILNSDGTIEPPQFIPNIIDSSMNIHVQPVAPQLTLSDLQAQMAQLQAHMSTLLAQSSS